MQLLADDYARNGFKTILLDYFGGDGIPTTVVFTPQGAQDFGIVAWRGRNPPTRALEITRVVMAALKAEGVTTFAAVGYCYGGRIGFDLAFTNEVSVLVTSHPSLVVEADLTVRCGTESACSVFTTVSNGSTEVSRRV